MYETTLLLAVISIMFPTLVCLGLLKANPLDFWSVVPIVTSVWVLIPGVATMASPELAEQLFSYGLQRLNYFGGMTETSLAGMLNYISISNICLTAGLIVARFISPPITMAEMRYHMQSRDYSVRSLMMALLVVVWIANLLYLSGFSVKGLVQVFTPAYYEERKFENYIVRYVHLLVPLVVATGIAVKKPKMSTLIFVGVTVGIIYFGTGQRRNLVTWFLYWGLLVSAMKVPAKTNSGRIPALVYMGSAAAVVLLIVVLGWWSRVYFTNENEGSAVNPFDHRSPVQVIFGSGATGITSQLLVEEYIRAEGVVPFHSLYYGPVQPVPRIWWPSKPVGVDNIIRYRFNYPVSPSIFWFSDLLFSFWYFSFAVMLLLPVILNFIMKSLISKGVWATVAMWAFANVLTLYKNGFGTFLTGVSGFIVVAAIPMYLAIHSRRGNRVNYALPYAGKWSKLYVG